MTEPTPAEPDNRVSEPTMTATELVEPQPVMLHMPVDIRSVSLAILATLASVFMLRWASAVFIPLMVGILFSYGLSPVVDWLALRRIPRALSAAVLVLGIVFGFGATVYSLSDEAGKLIESLPLAANKLRDTTRMHFKQTDNTLATVQKAATQLEQAK